MAERDPLEALAEQPARMRPRAVIIGGKRSADLTLDPDMAEIASLRGIAAERGAFVVRLRGARLDRDLAAALGREAARPDPGRGELCLLPATPHPRIVGAALPCPQRRAFRHAGRQVKHKDLRTRSPGPQRGDAASCDLV